MTKWLATRRLGVILLLTPTRGLVAVGFRPLAAVAGTVEPGVDVRGSTFLASAFCVSKHLIRTD